jgi:ketol-acid reductoisomerase
MPALTTYKKFAGKTLSPEKFKKIIEKLFSEGFMNTNGAISQLADYIGYKAWLQIEEFEDNNGHKIVLEFIKEFVNGRFYYHIKEVNVE